MPLAGTWLFDYLRTCEGLQPHFLYYRYRRDSKVAKSGGHLDAPEHAADPLEVQDDVRARIAARSKRRTLKDKEYKLLRLVSGVHAFTAYACFTSAFSVGISNSGNAVVTGLLVALGSCFSYVFIAIWRSRLPPIWLVVLPSTLFVILALFFGVFSLAFWLNLAAHVEIPVLYRLKKQLMNLPS